jgi:DNA-binding winged helix-turn-helix (wHTH) protein/TolB-like protein/Tfp pilus assembly protein PilF
VFHFFAIPQRFSINQQTGRKIQRLLRFDDDTSILLSQRKSFEFPLETVRKSVKAFMSPQVRHLYEFGPFRLDPGKPCLWRNGELVSLTPKALETLLVLIQQNGKLVEREDLMRAIWPDTFVEDGNLNFNVSMLRKALGTNDAGEQYIQTVPRHGYRFSADVREVTEEVPALVVERQPHKRRSGDREIAATGWRNKSVYGAIVLVSIALVAVASWYLLRRPATAGTQIRSIAILPLQPLHEDEMDKTLALGLTDTLVTRLGSLRSVAVRPIVSVGRYARGEQDPVELGRKLQVDAVLAGTLQHTEGHLRVNARLLRVADNTLIWSGSFDENESDIFKLQDQLSLQVTESLVSRLSDKERVLLARRYTENSEAFHAYWRGRFFFEKRNALKAVAEFRHAIDLDPNYALAYAGLADAYMLQATTTSGSDEELFENARVSINKSLALDPTLAESVNSQAQLKYFYYWDWPGAEQSFKRALELDPNSVDAHQFYARLLATLGRYPEALAEVERARELDPRSTDLAVPLFAILEKQGHYDEALKALETALQMDKDATVAQRAIGKIYLLKGEYAKVIELAHEHFPNSKEIDLFWASMLATAYYKIGQRDKATEMHDYLKKLAANDSKALYFLVMHYSEVGRIDEALAGLEKCLELREERMIWSKDEPRFAAIKDDPRFHSLLQKMNLPA